MTAPHFHEMAESDVELPDPCEICGYREKARVFVCQVDGCAYVTCGDCVSVLEPSSPSGGA